MERADLLDQLISIVEAVVSDVPPSVERAQGSPAARAQQLTMAAAARAAATSGALSLPPGPLGLLTVLPDLVAVWHIQRQLVADIAACYGRSGELRGETMFYCLFRHAAAQIVRDVAVRVGERLLLRRPSIAVMERSLQRVGLLVSERALARSVSRWLPVAGALGVGAYAFYDTVQVGRTAQQVFESEIAAEPRGVPAQ